jgi:ferredoxin
MTNADNDFVQMVVDTESCIGAGQCEMCEPDVFVLDDEVIATVIEPGVLLRNRAITVADRCPGRAIGFIELAENDLAAGDTSDRSTSDCDGDGLE